MKIKPKALILCLFVPLAAGALGAALAGGRMWEFQEIKKPALTPPGWVFPAVWTALYLTMGLASYLVLTARASREDIESALTVYGCQLAVNIFWPVLFFRLRVYLFAFFWLVSLWLLVIAAMAFFHKLDKRAGLMLIPYLLWVTFAGYLNVGVWLLN